MLNSIIALLLRNCNNVLTQGSVLQTRDVVTLESARSAMPSPYELQQYFALR